MIHKKSKAKVEKYSGRINGGDFKWEFIDSTDDSSYALNSELKTALNNYKSSLVSIQSIGSSGSDSGSGSGSVEETTVQAVIDAIDALPDSASVTSSDKTSINNANTMYQALSATDKALVTNYSKLEACLSALAALPTPSQYILTPSTNTDSFFSVTANLKSGVAAKTYDGVTYNEAYKMESSTSITFTTTASMTITIISDGASGKKIKIDGTNYTADSNGVFTITLAAGSHSITKGDSINVYAIIIE